MELYFFTPPNYAFCEKCYTKNMLDSLILNKKSIESIYKV